MYKSFSGMQTQQQEKVRLRLCQMVLSLPLSLIYSVEIHWSKLIRAYPFNEFLMDDI